MKQTVIYFKSGQKIYKDSKSSSLARKIYNSIVDGEQSFESNDLFLPDLSQVEAVIYERDEEEQ
jgi:hypothetical protein